MVWKVASEKNVSQYIIEKSDDGINFNELIKVNAKNIEDSFLSYSCEDNSPYDGITYYRLNTLENNGKVNHYNITELDRNNSDWKTVLYQNDNKLILEFKNTKPKNSTITLFDLTGKQIIDQSIEQLQTKISTVDLSTGIYFVKITTPYKTENFKIIIQNN